RGAHLFPHRLPRACGSSCAYPLRSRSLASSLHRLAAEADLRRTQLTRGEATLLSSHAGDPRAAAGDTTNVGQTGWSTPATRVSPSPAREPTPRVGRRRPVRSSVTVILRHRLPTLSGDPFGGCTGLVDVGVDHDPFDEAVVPPDSHFPVGEFNEPAAASRPPTLEVHGEAHAVV